ncbi:MULTISPECIES: extracellular matrix/biofilm biosynthesis regulator RemA family protein [Pseudobutyrivibrio]|jgi:hypothetical protein|uniref:Regulatory protein n=1 Tax=Pseudobutyrivibrio xylanivorans TaxID=185007 RepID=A0A1G5S4Y7_PSEXY|nr:MULTISPECIES: extracellular matrix/biofilm biosynthesis regulator RemA family protein [Pseudobutyrivibrio]MDC7278392.1 DUF370 domain-containing protein [Butyrivibrio fibrisolvens]SCZ81434.1 hypothetical protein SAMN02910350_02812 [Pseudobutyrivibrio xylanivorans]
MAFVNIGFGNIINSKKIVSMVTSDSAPAKRIIANAKEKGNIIDATQGRRTRCVIICDQHVVLSALMPDTISNRISENSTKEEADYDA